MENYRTQGKLVSIVSSLKMMTIMKNNFHYKIIDKLLISTQVIKFLSI